MFDWIATALVLSVGFLVIVTGLIEYVFIGFMIYLFISVIANIILYYSESTKE
ncbi:hypothetical protein N5C89_29360 [Klebsiella michiganensis]|uniref:Uncharacterized protein n=1 Tax=Klebsiella michiganensis TaxID=1134687 RepID=A0AAJ1KXT5_9ENTR|nr:hypothetical protein [Klebsiella michiganensis]MDH0966949.1 hypothetical protein [Klebsiella michiganensis]